MLKPNYAEWVGRTETSRDCLDVARAGMLHATVGDETTAPPTRGDMMPLLWHWAAFTPSAPMALLDTDGHPKRGGFLPAIPLERRMWAGGKLTFHHPLHVGAQLERRSTIKDIVEKSGSTGDMVFVTLEHAISEDGRLAVTEIQNIVYLPMPTAYRAPMKQPIFEKPDFAREVSMSEALLFRYSAATFNAHRIHYDLPYAQMIEKYPGLVIHGPLQATLLLAEGMAHTGRRPATFGFRGVHPMFCHERLALYGRDLEGSTELCTGVPGSHQGMSAKIHWED